MGGFRGRRADVPMCNLLDGRVGGGNTRREFATKWAMRGATRKKEKNGGARSVEFVSRARIVIAHATRTGRRYATTGYSIPSTTFPTMRYPNCVVIRHIRKLNSAYNPFIRANNTTFEKEKLTTRYERHTARGDLQSRNYSRFDFTIIELS